MKKSLNTLKVLSFFVGVAFIFLIRFFYHKGALNNYVALIITMIIVVGVIYILNLKELPFKND